jgi:thiamine-monophosphate kinase
MKIYEMGERRIIEAISAFAGFNRRVQVGFGDDGAVLRMKRKETGITITTDILVEGTHFLPDMLNLKDLGYKSYEVNASDIAAMGARPVAAFLSLGLKREMEFRSLTDFYKGFSVAAKRHGCLILGGDTVRSECFFISITLAGVHETGSRPLLRTGAKPGDRVYITGWPGESGMGFNLLKNKRHRIQTLNNHPLVTRHIRPKSRVKEGMVLARCGSTGAVIDVSDGVYNELHLLSGSSKKKILINLPGLPVSRILRKEAESEGLDPLQLVLFGGEDYELLFTSSLNLPRIKRMFERKGIRCPLHEIGRVEEGSGVVFIDEEGKPISVDDRTYQHFPRKRS